MFDQNGDGVITSEEMVTAMRGLGHNPTRREVAEMLGIDPTKGKYILHQISVLFVPRCHDKM